MKRIISLLCIICLCIVCAACSNDGATIVNPKPENSISSPNTSDVSKESTPSDPFQGEWGFYSGKSSGYTVTVLDEIDYYLIESYESSFGFEATIGFNGNGTGSIKTKIADEFYNPGFTYTYNPSEKTITITMESGKTETTEYAFTSDKEYLILDPSQRGMYLYRVHR